MFAKPQTMQYAVILLWSVLMRTLKGQARVYPPVYWMCFSGRTDVIRSDSPRVFLINQIYHRCAMHHKSIAFSMQTILQIVPIFRPRCVCVCARACMCVCVCWERIASSWLGSYESFIGFYHPRRENALNVFAIIPLITALRSWAKSTLRNCKLVSQ